MRSLACSGYAVAWGCNPESQQRRGQLHGYAVAPVSIHMHAGACVWARACGCACWCNRVTVQLARRAAGVTVTRARNRDTSSLFHEKEKGHGMDHQPDRARWVVMCRRCRFPGALPLAGAQVSAGLPPRVGTPTAPARGGNSAPARELVAGLFHWLKNKHKG
jgi:hypothetical protein